MAAAISLVIERPHGVRMPVTAAAPLRVPFTVPFFEGQAVRTAVGVALVSVCLGLAGCSLFGKKQAAPKTNPKPFLGSESATADRRDAGPTTSLPRDSGGPLPGANGLLAGRVVVAATDRPIKAAILIRNLERDDDKGASLDFATDDSGYFTIPKLNAGEPYLLIARASDNGELISRTVYVKPPNPTLLVRLDKCYTTPSTPPPPEMPKLPGKKNTNGTESSQEHKPAVSIDAPIQLHDAGPQPAGGSGANPGNGAAPNPANIANNGFRRLAQPSEVISIPPPPPPPQQPQWESVPNQPQPGRSTLPTSPGSVRVPNIATPVPSCALLGNRLDNLALYDMNGKVWEYKRDHRGRLTLLDFWRHNCGPCLHCIPYLIDLQRDFAKYGLEVIGIACELGTVEEQHRNVRPILNRMGVNYRVLLSGGGSGHCPVMSQFQVERLPKLVLIDESGYIIYRSPDEGMSNEDYYDLRGKINSYLVARQAQP